MRSHWFVRFGAAALIGLAFALIVTLGAARAEGPPVSSDPPQLEISANMGGAFGTTFHLSTTETVSGLRVIANELRPVADDRGVTLPPIQPTQIEVQSTNEITQLVASQGRERWSVEITNVPTEHGTWSGNLVVEWTDTPPGSLAIHLTVKSISKPELEVYDPAKIVMKGVRGDSITRTVTLRETVGGSDVTGLEVVSPDLQNEEQNAVLPASQIHASIPASASPGDYPQVKVGVDLAPVRAGSYSGKLLVTSTNADDLPVDIEVKVKDHWGLPAFVLFFGLVITILFSIYRALGLARDEVRVGFQRLEKFKLDPDFNRLFGRLLDAKKQEAEEAFRKKETEKAKTALQQAKDLCNRWNEEREKYLRYIGQVETQLQAMEQWPPSWLETVYVQTLKEHLESIKGENVPKYLNAAAMWDDKARTYKALEMYREAKVGLQELQKLWEEAFLQEEARGEIKEKLDGLEETLKQVDEHKPEILEDAKKDIGLPTKLDLGKFKEDLGKVETELAEAVEKAKEAISHYYGCHDKALKLSKDIQDGSPVKSAIEDVLNEAQGLLSRLDFAGAAKRAQNAWWAALHETGLFSHARGLKEDAAEQAEKDAAKEFKKLSKSLNAFLYDRVSYGHSPGDDTEAAGTFRGEMKPHREAVLRVALAVLLAKDPNFKFEPGHTPLESPTTAMRRIRNLIIGEKAAREIEIERGVSVRALDARPLEWAAVQFEEIWVRFAGVRLLLFQIATFVIAFVVLYLTAWQNQYVGNETFGSFANYRDLLLWGFGVGLTREAVIALVTGWGIPISTQG